MAPLKCVGCGNLTVEVCDRPRSTAPTACQSPLCLECSDDGELYCPSCEAELSEDDDADDLDDFDDLDDDDDDDLDDDVDECPVCGGDRNTGDCDCDGDETPPKRKR